MKKLLLIITFSIFFSGYGQPEKDALLQRDIEQVKDTLVLMKYLDQCTVEFLRMTKQEISKSNSNFTYHYENTIISNNPAPSINIPVYLGYKNGYVPPTWQYFLTPVFEKNALQLINLIETYGYPTNKRIYGSANATTCMVIVDRAPQKYKDILWPLLKREKRRGNMTDIDFEFCKFFIKSNKCVSEKEFMRFNKKMEKLGAKMKIPGE